MQPTNPNAQTFVAGKHIFHILSTAIQGAFVEHVCGTPLHDSVAAHLFEALTLLRAHSRGTLGPCLVHIFAGTLPNTLCGRRCGALLIDILAGHFCWFFPNSNTCYGVFSTEYVWCDPAQLQHQVPEKVPEGSGAFRCRWLMKSRRVPVQMADEVSEFRGR